MRYFYECGGCDHLHPLGWTGDCRDDTQRYTSDVLDEPDVMVMDEHAPIPPDGVVPRQGVEYGCGVWTCADCYQQEGSEELS